MIGNLSLRLALPSRSLGAGLIVCFALLTLPLPAQTAVPKWCSALPRPEFKTLERVPVSGGWFEVYKVAPGVLAIYEPHQSEETIGYLVSGNELALLFDTGMGIGDLKALTAELTHLPIVVLNSHTHNDHVGNNWQFDTVYSMDTSFTRTNALGSRDAAQEEIKPGEICGSLPKGFDRAAYATRPWKVSQWIHDGENIDLGGRSLQVIVTPGHTPDSICLFDKANGLLFTGDTYYQGNIWLFAPGTDLDAYATSVHRLAALAPQVKLVLGAHNVPDVSPSVLPQLAAAFDAVRAGKAQGTFAADGKILYKSGGMSFMMRAPQTAH
jgi:glyoxylase-like metal-dependent hydrolase (beta-lactamase superfamily II)